MIRSMTILAASLALSAWGCDDGREGMRTAPKPVESQPSDTTTAPASPAPRNPDVAPGTEPPAQRQVPPLHEDEPAAEDQHMREKSTGDEPTETTPPDTDEPIDDEPIEDRPIEDGPIDHPIENELTGEPYEH